MWLHMLVFKQLTCLLFCLDLQFSTGYPFIKFNRINTNGVGFGGKSPPKCPVFGLFAVKPGHFYPFPGHSKELF